MLPCHGSFRKLPWQLPRNAVGMVGTTEFATDRIAARAVAIAADFRANRCVSEDCRRRERPRMAVEIASVERPRKLLWQLPRSSMGFHGWYDRVTRQNRGTCRGHNRGIRLGSAMSRCACRGNPRISTVADGNTHGSPRKSRGHCHGPPPRKCNNVHSCSMARPLEVCKWVLRSRIFDSWSSS